MEICVIGCTGYLGSKISEYFFNKGYKVIGVCRNFPQKNKSFKSLFDQIIQGDITNKTTLEKILQLKIQNIIYTVSLNHIESETDMTNSIKINYIPIVKLAQLSKSKKIKINLFYFSTMQVYGRYEQLRNITDSQVKSPENIYALTHSLCEDTLYYLNKTEYFKSVSIRLSNGYGYPCLVSSDCWWLVINDFCKSAIKNKVIKLNSDGTTLRDFIHINDVARATYKLVTTKKNIPPQLNLASGKSISMLEIASLVNKLTNKYIHPSKIFLQKRPISNSELEKKIKIISKSKKFRVQKNIMKKFNILPTISLQNGIMDTLIKLKNNND